MYMDWFLGMFKSKNTNKTTNRSQFNVNPINVKQSLNVKQPINVKQNRNKNRNNTRTIIRNNRNQNSTLRLKKSYQLTIPNKRNSEYGGFSQNMGR